MDTEKLSFIAIVSLVAVVAIVGLLPTNTKTVSTPMTAPVIEQDQTRDNVMGQAGFRQRDGSRQDELRNQFIRDKEREILTCAAIADNKYTKHQLNRQTLTQDRDIQNCLEDIHPDAEIISVSKTDSKHTQNIDVNVCVGGIPVVGTVCSDDVINVIDRVGDFVSK